MKNYEKILKEKEVALFFVKNQDKQKFLKFAKSIGCKWANNRTIDVLNDECKNFMAIDNNFTLGFISPMCWVALKRNNEKINVFEIKERIC